MRVVVQRVAQARVTVEPDYVAEIGVGLLLLVGVERGDGLGDVAYVADKSVELRVFNDNAGRMNRSLLEVGGEALLVSQFTLYGDVRRGRRPSFSQAEDPASAERLYEELVAAIRGHGVPTCQGRFGAHMSVRCTNNGPVTILLDSRRLF